jgi:hypothetical protein
MPDYSDLEARALFDSYAADPVGTHQAISQELAQAGYQTQPEDPRLAEMYADYQRNNELLAYDAEVERLAALNPDVNPNRLHTYIAAADGDFEAAVSMYRNDTAQALSDHTAAEPPPTDPNWHRERGLTGQQGLHAAIDDLRKSRR